MDGAEDSINLDGWYVADFGFTLDCVGLMKSLYGFMYNHTARTGFGTRRPDRYILLTPPSVTPFSL